MTDFDIDSASSQLRVIRSLMERATIYRSLSAPTACVGGLLSLFGFAVAYYAKHHEHRQLSPSEFLVVWMIILVLTCLTNALFLWREAQRRSTPFFSAGMKCAMRSVVPPFISAGILTLLFVDPMTRAACWILFYGLGLLAMQHFAPRSLVVLGWTFLVTVLALAGYLAFAGWPTPNFTTLQASWLMAATFGGFHLAYAAAVWALGEDRADSPAVAPNGAENV
jgi:hypothetical protein